MGLCCLSLEHRSCRRVQERPPWHKFSRQGPGVRTRGEPFLRADAGASPVTDLGRFCGGKRAGGFEAECRSGFTGFAVSLGSGAFGLGKRLKTKPSSLAMLCPGKTTPSELFNTAVLCTPMIFGPRSKRSDNHAISRMVVVLSRRFDQACQLQYMKPHAII